MTSKLKFYKRITTAWFIIIFASCSTPTFYKTSIVPSNNIILMPYIDKTGYYGYVNSETFEIVIPAQYRYADSFVNGFAIVAKEWERYKKTKYSIINQNNEVVIKNLDYAHIIETEDRKTIFALTKNYSGLEFYETTGGGLFFSYRMLSHSPSHTTYRLYNLKTGKLVWKKREQHYSHDAKIYFFANYMTFREDIYEIKNDGVFEKKDMGAKEFRKLVAEILKERKLENVFSYSNYRYYDDLYNETLNFDLLNAFGSMSIATIDFDLLIQNLPEEFRLSFDMWEKGDDWVDYAITLLKPINGKVYSYAINNDEFQPFLEKAWLVVIPLYTKDWKRYIGLYNTSENEWAIPPIKRETFSKFKMTGYDGLICYTSDQTDYPYFYNIKTREKTKYLYEYDSYRETMAYMGYYDSENKVIIEKF